MNEDLFEFQDEDDEDPEIISDLSSGGSNVWGSDGSGSCLKRPRKKGHMDNFFTHDLEMIVQHRNNTEKLLSIMSTKKRPRRELIYYFVDGYDTTIPFNTVNYASFQQMF